mgnify:CR=1 FL=1
MLKPVIDSDYSSLLSELCAAISSGRADLACYQQNFLGGHRQALEKTFPFTQQLLGRSVFAALATAYVEHYPSVHWDINLYGEAFTALLGAQCQSERADAFDWGLVSAIAQLEYRVCWLYYAPMDTSLTVNGLSSHSSALAVSSAEDFAHGLMICHPYLDVSPVINLSQPLLLSWQGLRLLLANSLVNRIPESVDV